MADPRQYLNDPKVRKYLDVIAMAEGVKHGYNTIFGNERFGNLNAHPNVRKQFKQTDGKVNYTTAAGRYQFLKPTWDGLTRQYGLKDFSPQSQDIAAIGLLIQNGALPHILKGDYQTATQKSGRTWASLPSSPYAQPKRSQAEIDKFLGGASSLGGQPKPHGLTVQQLTAKYGKSRAVDSSMFGKQAQQPQGLTVQTLTAKYGQPKNIDPVAVFGGQSAQTKGLTVQELTAKYGSPTQVDLSTLTGNNT